MEEKFELYVQNIHQNQEEIKRFWTYLDDGYQVVIYLKPLWSDTPLKMSIIFFVTI